MAVNFKELLKKKADDCKPEPALPDGTYRAIVEKFDVGTTQKNETPFVRYSYRLQSAEDDVDASALIDESGNPINLSEVVKSTSFWLTKKADHMLVAFIASCGVKTSGRELAEIIPEAVGATILVPITQKIDEKDPTKVYNVIGDIVGA